MSSTLTAKRSAPLRVKPISNGKYLLSEMRTIETDKYSVFIICKKPGDNRPVWKTKLYEKQLNPNLEFDAQDIYLKSMDLKNDVLIAVDEMNLEYRIHIETGKLLKPEHFHSYQRQ